MFMGWSERDRRIIQLIRRERFSSGRHKLINNWKAKIAGSLENSSKTPTLRPHKRCFLCVYTKYAGTRTRTRKSTGTGVGWIENSRLEEFHRALLRFLFYFYLLLFNRILCVEQVEKIHVHKTRWERGIIFVHNFKRWFISNKLFSVDFYDRFTLTLILGIASH